MPDDRGLCASRRGTGGQALDRQTAALGERPLRIDIRADGVAVMDEEEMHISRQSAVGSRQSAVSSQRSNVEATRFDRDRYASQSA